MFEIDGARMMLRNEIVVAGKCSFVPFLWLKMKKCSFVQKTVQLERVDVGLMSLQHDRLQSVRICCGTVVSSTAC